MKIQKVPRPKLKNGRRRPTVETHVFATIEEVEQLGITLIPVKQASKEVYRSQSMLGYWIRQGYVKKYYVHGNRYNYLVDLDEVLKQIKLGQERLRNPHPKSYYHKDNRHENGKFK